MTASDDQTVAALSLLSVELLQARLKRARKTQRLIKAAIVAKTKEKA